ncbi:MAG: zf-HC2 domain-containing protein [Armatimonadetes bacterium]|nr:zf-HC2 domain-containing protein [Armatimonadota bacterium]
MRFRPCDWVGEHLSAYLDEALSGREMRQVAAHLITCHACRGALDDLRATKQALQGAEMPRPAPDFWPEVYAQVRQKSVSLPAPGISRSTWRAQLAGVWTVPRALATAAAMAAMLLLSILTRPTAPPASAPDDLGEFIAQHAQHSTAYPLSDWSRMMFIGSEANAPATVPVADESGNAP